MSSSTGKIREKIDSAHLSPRNIPRAKKGDEKKEPAVDPAPITPSSLKKFLREKKATPSPEIVAPPIKIFIYPPKSGTPDNAVPQTLAEAKDNYDRKLSQYLSNQEDQNFKTDLITASSLYLGFLQKIDSPDAEYILGKHLDLIQDNSCSCTIV